MNLVIVAGGKGTRLGLTDRPKPMALLAGKPLLDHQIRAARRCGIDNLFILSGHMGHAIYDRYGDGRAFGVRITHFIEPRPLGTAGSVRQLIHLLNDRFLVVYGDVFFDVDLERMRRFDRERRCCATLLAHPSDHPLDSDLLEAGPDGIIRRILPKPHRAGRDFQNLASAALYILSPEVLRDIPFGKALDFGRDVFPALVRGGRRLAAYRTPEYVKDIGTPERLRRVDADCRAGRPQRMNLGRPQKAVFLDRDGVINRFTRHVGRPADFELNPGAAEAIARINRSGYRCYVVTNQPGLAKGFLTPDGLERVHRKMETALAREGAFVDDIFFCPHHPERGFNGEVNALKIACACRKPRPGLLLAAARRYNVSLRASWMVGDSRRDVDAGRRAGCRPIFIANDREAAPAAARVVGDLGGAVEHILSRS